MRSAVVLAIVAVPAIAAADRNAISVDAHTIELAADEPLIVGPEGEGWLITARGRPTIWIGPYRAPCAPRDGTLAMPRPLGFQIADPMERPPLQAEAWNLLCLAGDTLTVRVLVEVGAHDAGDGAHVEQILASVRTALRPPLEVVPGLVLDRARYDEPVLRGDRPGSLVADGVFLDVSMDQPRCTVAPRPAYVPAGTPPPAVECVELPDRGFAVALRDPRPGALPIPAVALSVRTDLLTAAETTFGTAAIVRGHYRPGWANGELPLDRLPLGLWKVSTKADLVVLNQIDGPAAIELAPGPCRALDGPPAGAARVTRPRFFPPLAREAWVSMAGGWSARACFSMLDTPVAVTLSGLSGPPDEATARAFAAALTDVAGAPRIFAAIALERGGSGLGLMIDTWMAGALSWFAQFEVYDAGAESNGALSSARLEGGAGPGYSRPGLRAGVHAGFSLERVAVNEAPGLDQNGGALFLEARVHAGRRAFVQASVRGAWFFDLDCTEVQDEEEDLFCGPSNHADHHADLGLEAELRLGLGLRRKGFLVGGYLGARWFVVRSDGDDQSHALVTLGFATW